MVWCAYPVFFKRRRRHYSFWTVLRARIECRPVNKMAEAPDIELQDLKEQKEEEKGEEETNVDEDDGFVTDVLGIDNTEPPSDL